MKFHQTYRKFIVHTICHINLSRLKFTQQLPYGSLKISNGHRKNEITNNQIELNWDWLVLTKSRWLSNGLLGMWNKVRQAPLVGETGGLGVNRSRPFQKSSIYSELFCRLLQNIYRNCVTGLGFLFFFFTRPHGTHVLAIGDHSEFWSRALLRRFFLSLLFIFFKEKAEMIGHRLFTRQSNSRGDTRDSHEGKASSSRTARPVCNFHRGWTCSIRWHVSGHWILPRVQPSAGAVRHLGLTWFLHNDFIETSEHNCNQRKTRRNRQVQLATWYRNRGWETEIRNQRRKGDIENDHVTLIHFRTIDKEQWETM